MQQLRISTKTNFRRFRSMMIALTLALSLFSTAQADVVTDWNEIAVRSYVEAGLSHQEGARALAILHIAIHDALNDIDRRYDTYAVNAYATPQASPEAAAAAAAHAVLIAAIPSQQGSIDAAYALSLSHIPDGGPKTDGIALGERVAAAIIGLRSADGSTATVAYTPVNAPGRWQPTPPDFLPPLVPQWRYLTPFTLLRASQFRAPAPPALTSRAYARDFNEVKEIGGIGSTRRSAEQSEIAQFWYEGSPITWNLIARTVAADRPKDLWEHARLFALLNLALSDSWVAGWETKYLYDFWRPVTAIRAAGTDGNPATFADPNWTSFLVNSSHPEYISTHSVLGGAASAVLTLFYGKDEVDFSITTGTAPNGVVRSFRSFSQASNENSNSRVYAGVHFRTAIVEGVKLGREVGRYVFQNSLRTIHERHAGVHSEQ